MSKKSLSLAKLERKLAIDANQPSQDIPNDMSKELSLPSKGLSLDICQFLEEKKCQKVLLLELYKVNPYFDYFVIASASSILHLNFLSQTLYKHFRKEVAMNNRKEAQRDSRSGWVAVDFLDLVVHIFLEEQRAFYNLERLWGDANVVYPKQDSNLKQRLKALDYERGMKWED